MAMREQQIQTKIIKYLESQGAYCIKIIKASKAGVADLICCYQGEFIAFEVKTATGKTSALQDYHIDLVGMAGGRAYVVRSVDDVGEVLKI